MRLQTKGDLGAAVTRFVDWLAMLTVKKETEHMQTHGGKQPKAKIVLCGHSCVPGPFLSFSLPTSRANTDAGPIPPRASRRSHQHGRPARCGRAHLHLDPAL